MKESSLKNIPLIRSALREFLLGLQEVLLKDFTNREHIPEVKAQISQIAMNENGICDTVRILKVDRNTVMNYFIKSNRVLFVNPAYAFIPSAELVIKVDKMRSFASKMKVPQWALVA